MKNGQKNSKQIRGMEWLGGFVNTCGLTDVTSLGMKFSWSNNGMGEDATYEKLDRAMCNMAWAQRFA